MKLEDLKKLAIGAGGSSIRVEITPPGSPILTAILNLGIDSGMFNDRQTALLAAARFRASDEMYQELRKIHQIFLSEFHAALEKEDAEIWRQRVGRIARVLAIANNTNETL